MRPAPIPAIVTTDDIQFAEFRMSIAIPDEAYQALLLSETPLTGNAAYQHGQLPLSVKLEMAAQVSDVTYSPMFGGYLYYSVAPGLHNEELVARVMSVINEHLEWCLSLGKEVKA